ncbi:uncharacterized protein LOC135337609 [Halichondria panicea]|uniref:uncharacterized protein LOC135337609 n=1 Tax=Halichondria panicea TaxID=6063 RepID=UPI00312B70D5
MDASSTSSALQNKVAAGLPQTDQPSPTLDVPPTDLKNQPSSTPTAESEEPVEASSVQNEVDNLATDLPQTDQPSPTPNLPQTDQPAPTRPDLPRTDQPFPTDIKNQPSSTAPTAKNEKPVETSSVQNEDNAATDLPQTDQPSPTPNLPQTDQPGPTTSDEERVVSKLCIPSGRDEANVARQQVRSALSPKRLAEKMLASSNSTLCDKQNRIYQLKLREGKKIGLKIARCYIGNKPATSVQEKVLMVVGATGAGKSTLINGIVNYLFGVEWNDQFRFKMINEHPGTQAKSVTSMITAYTIYQQEGSPCKCTLTIIDTPGFGDTSGLERDKEITKQIKEFFSIPCIDGGIDHLDGIGFVTQSSLARLTHTQKYIFDSILSTFGKDIGNNIFMMITFADGKKPPVVDAINASDIPYRKYFKFNNSALFPIIADEEEYEEGDFDEMFWTMGIKSFHNFFMNFELVEPRSLQLTREVLEERQRLEANVKGLQPRINEGLAKIEEMRKERRIVEEHEADIETNKQFKYTITVTKQRRVDFERGRYVTNCLTCNYTCHKWCGISDDRDKYGCAAMDGGGYSSALCKVCPEHCGWRQHVNNPYYFEIYQEDEERTSEELKLKFDAAKEGKARVEYIIQETERRLTQMDELVMDMIQQVQQSVNRLGHIALKPNPLSEVEYIEIMIKSEKAECKTGWDERVQYLESAKKQAQITQGIAKEDIGQNKKIENREGLWMKIKSWWNKDPKQDKDSGKN